MSAPLPLPGTTNPFTAGYQNHQFFTGSPNAPIGSRQVISSLASPAASAVTAATQTPLVEEAAFWTLTPQVITITNGPASGTFTLNYFGYITSAIQYNASAATVQTALNALSLLAVNGGVVVTGAAGGPWTVNLSNVTAPIQMLKVQNSSLVTTPGSGLPAITITSSAQQAGIVPF